MNRSVRPISWLPVALFAALLDTGASAEVTPWQWPAQAGFSDTYKVFIQSAAGAEREVQVLMSRAQFQGDYRARELDGRTFSFVPLSVADGAAPVQVRVVKTFGGRSESVSVSPRRWQISAELGPDAKQATFRIDGFNRYLSVHFAGPDNRTASCGWIRHMLCLFIDPPEADVPSPTAPGVAVYSAETAPEALRRAEVIFVPPGYHDLRRSRHGGIIEEDGRIILGDRQRLYLAGGSFVEGLVETGSADFVGQRLYGRGILSGRQYLWHRHPDHRGPSYRQIVNLGNSSKVEGVTIMESPCHGIVGGTCDITNVKLLGWHCNNDAVRVAKGSEISHSFFRAVDDHFYNFAVRVHHVVLWAGHNGAILTYGWGGNEKTYNSGASILEDIDIIHPEWTALGDNNGLVAAQVGLDYRPFGYGGQTTTTLRNIRIEGTIPGILNLKPFSSRERIVAPRIARDRTGYLGDLVLENVTVEHQFGRGRLLGEEGAATDGSGVFRVRNVTFRNVQIGGVRVTETNRSEFFDIDSKTTEGLVFE
jgi:hypothetical protein